MATIKPTIWDVAISNQTVNVNTSFTVTAQVRDLEVFYHDMEYAKTNNFEVICGQQLGVI